MYHFLVCSQNMVSRVFTFSIFIYSTLEILELPKIFEQIQRSLYFCFMSSDLDLTFVKQKKFTIKILVIDGEIYCKRTDLFFEILFELFLFFILV